MKLLIAYDSRAGHTAKKAEAGRIGGLEVDVKKISEIKNKGKSI